MSDSAQALRRKPNATFIVAGLTSSLLFLSMFLACAFLLPVQIIFGRRGWREGMAAVGVSALGIAIAEASKLAVSGSFAQQDGRMMTGIVALAGTVLTPVVLLLALALMNAPLWGHLDPAYRILGVTAASALIALPVLLSIERDASIAAFLEERIRAVLTPLRNAVTDSSDGYEASALAASLDPKDIVATSFALLRNSFAAILFTLLGGSWWLGNRMSGRGSRGWEQTASLEDLRLPYAFLWGFLAFWSFMLAVELLKIQGVAPAVAWNCALVVSLAYAAVGLGIVTYLLKAWNTPKSLRICLAIIAVLSLATPLGIAVVVSLPLLGVTEIWIHYRKPKGVGA
jgi:hypothetical protein